MQQQSKRRYLIPIGFILIVSLAVIWLTSRLVGERFKPNPPTRLTSPTASAPFYKLIDACTIFSLTDARQLAGSSLSAVQNQPPLSFSDMQESSCAYQDSPTNPSNQRGLSVTIRSPRNQAGQARNQQQFLAVPKGKQLLTDLGDQAYWDTDTRELNVLKNSYWLILISDYRLYKRELTDAQAMAKLILPKIEKPLHNL